MPTAIIYNGKALGFYFRTDGYWWQAYYLDKDGIARSLGLFASAKFVEDVFIERFKLSQDGDIELRVLALE